MTTCDTLDPSQSLVEAIVVDIDDFWTFFKMSKSTKLTTSDEVQIFCRIAKRSVFDDTAIFLHVDLSKSMIGTTMNPSQDLIICP